MIKYKRYAIIDGKPRLIIVDKSGNIVNRNPSKDELKGLDNEKYKISRRIQPKFTGKELLNELRRAEKEYGRPRDFINNPEYPGYAVYSRRFGSWFNALILAGVDVDLMGPQGTSYRGRQTEIAVLNHFKQHPTDLSGENQNSYCDGLCPNDEIFEVKSSRLKEYKGSICYEFITINKDKDDDREAIEWYYLVALNDDGTVKYAWRIPGEMAEGNKFIVGTNSRFKFNVENMKEYEITDKF